MADFIHHPASFKDPSGFVFKRQGNYYRQVNKAYAGDFELLMSSGLYESLVRKGLLISHTTIDENYTGTDIWYKTLLPEQLSFISYPYEWSFDQLKDAALLTLDITKTAVSHGMILKDATGFNIQFHQGKPVFIDSLSFEKYDPSLPWIAYRQFCECFLFPLLLEHYLQVDIQKLLSVYLEGIPVKIAAKLLPGKSKLKLSVWLHVFLQNTVSKGNRSKQKPVQFSKQKLLGLISHLESTVKSLHTKAGAESTWNNYYEETILSQNYLAEKEKLFRLFINDINDGRALDMGCNDGYFSRILAERIPNVISADFDSQCINRLYLSIKNKSQTSILPLCIDISNPPPATGFLNEERQAFLSRAGSDYVAALALIHHLVLTKNIPFAEVAKLFAGLTKKTLIIEFVPLEDEKAQQLIENKKTYHKPYDAAAFENYFNAWFDIEKKEIIPGTARILYRMKKK